MVWTDRRYIGDGVYVALDEANRLVVYTQHGAHYVNHKIVFEPEVLAELKAYISECVEGRTRTDASTKENNGIIAQSKT